MNTLRIFTALAVLWVGAAAPAWAQVAADEMASQSLRPYAHVFVAYAIVWLLIGGWIVSIHRRLGRVGSTAD